MPDLKSIEDRITKIEIRNQRVEADKKWETSLARKLSIAVVTYIALSMYFGLVVGVNPWINAIVPTVGFLLSTLSLSFIKRWWIGRQDASN